MRQFKTYGCLALVFGLCSQLSAREDWPPEPGTLVRISASRVFQRSTDVVSTYRQTKFTGTVIAVVSDTLEIQVENSSLHLIIPDVYLQKVEVSCGYKKTKASEGAMLGFLIGLATGYAIGASTENTDFQGLYGLLGGMAGVALGVPTGAIIGNQIGGACWREITIGGGSSGNIHPGERHP